MSAGRAVGGAVTVVLQHLDPVVIFHVTSLIQTLPQPPKHSDQCRVLLHGRLVYLMSNAGPALKGNRLRDGVGVASGEGEQGEDEGKVFHAVSQSFISFLRRTINPSQTFPPARFHFANHSGTSS